MAGDSAQRSTRLYVVLGVLGVLVAVLLATLVFLAGRSSNTTPAAATGTTAAPARPSVPVNEPAPVPHETGRVRFEHPTWGTAYLVTSLDSSPGQGHVQVVDRTGTVRWAATPGPDDWLDSLYTLEVNKPPTDRTHNLFVLYNPGRYDGIMILRPVQGGMTLLPDGSLKGYYAGGTEDLDSDGVMEIVTHANQCISSCAAGPTLTIFTAWNGSNYADGSCPDVAFAPKSGDVATRITAYRVGCADAATFLRHVRQTHNPYKGPERFDLDGYQCDVSRDSEANPPVAAYDCRAPGKGVAWLKH